NGAAGANPDSSRRDSEMLIKLLGRSRSPKSAHSDKNAVRPKPFPPAKIDRCLHPDAGSGPQNGVLIALILARKQFPARHRHHGGFDAFCLQGLGGGGGELHFGAGRDQSDIAAPLRLGEHIGASGREIVVRVHRPQQRQTLAGERQNRPVPFPPPCPPPPPPPLPPTTP